MWFRKRRHLGDLSESSGTCEQDTGKKISGEPYELHHKDLITPRWALSSPVEQRAREAQSDVPALEGLENTLRDTGTNPAKCKPFRHSFNNEGWRRAE